MIFINGIELKGWSAPNALIRTVEEVAASDPPPRSAAGDHPPLAFEKYIADWWDQPKLELPPDREVWFLGPENAKITVVLWGDYQEPGTAEADGIVRTFAAGRTDVRYLFRHFPFDSDCNPEVKERRHENACRTALAAEAAGRLGGNEGFWKLHAWLMENQKRFNDDALRDAAVKLGFDADTLMTLMQERALQAKILDDIRAGKQLPKLRHGMPAGIYTLPTIFVNGHFVPRWHLEGKPILKEILSEAAKKAGS